MQRAIRRRAKQSSSNSRGVFAINRVTVNMKKCGPSIEFGICWRSITLVLLMLAFMPMHGAAVAQDKSDPLEPQSDVRNALASPLKAVTIMTGNLDLTRRFYQGALGMTPTFLSMRGPKARTLALHWGMAPTDTLQMVTFSRPGQLDQVAVRAILIATDTPSNRPGYDSAFAGALGMGFPANDLKTRDAIVSALGFKSVVGVTSMSIPRADRSIYDVSEVDYEAPDDVLVLGVDRGDMRPVGPVDPAIGIGGPAYASMLVRQAKDAVPLFGEVLGYEMRRELNFKSPGSAGRMRLPQGAEIRFQQWFAPGSRTSYLVIIDLLNADKPNPTELSAKNRGIAMWSFEVKNLQQARARARKAKVAVVKEPAMIDLPGVGAVRSMILATADGFLVEVIEARPQTALTKLAVR